MAKKVEKEPVTIDIDFITGELSEWKRTGISRSSDRGKLTKGEERWLKSQLQGAYEWSGDHIKDAPRNTKKGKDKILRNRRRQHMLKAIGLAYGIEIGAKRKRN